MQIFDGALKWQQSITCMYNCFVYIKSFFLYTLQSTSLITIANKKARTTTSRNKPKKKKETKTREKEGNRKKCFLSVTAILQQGLLCFTTANNKTPNLRYSILKVTRPHTAPLNAVSFRRLTSLPT